jgi:hypothetical protein
MLHPRNIPQSVDYRGQVTRDPERGYLDILGVNDWVFIYVNPFDGDDPEPLVLGFIDYIGRDHDLDQVGTKVRSINITGSGWQKAIDNTVALAHPFISRQINIASLIDLGPAGRAIEQRDGEDTVGTPGTLEFQRLIPYALEWLLQVFLHADRNDARGEGAATGARGIGSEIETAGSTADESTSEDVRPILGQFELPGSGGGFSLWHFIRLRFQAVKQRVFMDPNMFLQQTNVGLVHLMDAMSNQPINELFYDVRRVQADGLEHMDRTFVREIEGGYSSDNIRRFVEAARRVSPSAGMLADNIAPYVIFRKRPLFADELLELDGPVIDSTDITQSQLGASDADLNNLILMECTATATRSPIRIISGFPGLQEYRGETLRSIARHGLRFMEESTAAWPSDAAAPHPTPELVRDWELRLSRAGLDEPNLWTGELVIPKFIRGLFLGGKIGVRHAPDLGITNDRHNRVYYVDGLDYSYIAETGQFITSVAVTRGYRVDGFSDE